jgi:broad specificity phosphatase PhoE
VTSLIFVRHGETDWNLAGRIQGSSDIPLNDTGRRQAREAAADLREQLLGDLLVDLAAVEWLEVLLHRCCLLVGPADDEAAYLFSWRSSEAAVRLPHCLIV